MRDEKVLRKPEFADGLAIVLSDGQAWVFPRPTIDLFPELDDSGNVSIGGRPAFGASYDAKLDAFYEAQTPSDKLRCLMGLAVDLLGKNYTLAAADYRDLLRYRSGDDANAEMWRRISETAQGLDTSPKA